MEEYGILSYVLNLGDNIKLNEKVGNATAYIKKYS
jgi:hypothetical protein